MRNTAPIRLNHPSPISCGPNLLDIQETAKYTPRHKKEVLINRNGFVMHKYVHTIILRIVDGALYGFIGPFSVLYIIPQFLMNISHIKARAGFGIPGIKTAGLMIIWFGAALAVWCTILMFLFGKGTPLVTSAPQKILNRNIYPVFRPTILCNFFKKSTRQCVFMKLT